MPRTSLRKNQVSGLHYETCRAGDGGVFSKSVRPVRMVFHIPACQHVFLNRPGGRQWQAWKTAAMPLLQTLPTLLSNRSHVLQKKTKHRSVPPIFRRHRRTNRMQGQRRRRHLLPVDAQQRLPPLAVGLGRARAATTRLARLQTQTKPVTTMPVDHHPSMHQPPFTYVVPRSTNGRLF